MQLADHINLWTSIPSTVLFGAVITLIALPVSSLALMFGFFLPKPFGVIAGTLLGIVSAYGALWMWNCWGCDDHQINRRFIDPAATYVGALAMSYAIARLGRAGKDKHRE